MAFFAAITAPGVLHWSTPDDPKDIIAERRSPATPPRLPMTWNEWHAWPSSIERYFTDFLPGRTSLIRANNWLRLFVFRSSPSPHAIVGKDGWIFYTGDHTLEKHSGTFDFTDRQARRIADMLEQRRRWLDQRGIRFLVVFTPDKHAIYPEKLPDWTQGSHDESPFDKLCRIVERETSIEFLDLRPALEKAKREELVYNPYGTHWNNKGLYAAYVRTLKQLDRTLPEHAPFEPLSVRWIPMRGSQDSWGEQWHLNDHLLHDDHFVGPSTTWPMTQRTPWWPHRHSSMLMSRTWTRPEEDLPRLLLMHDSFGPLFRDLLASHFKEAISLPHYELIEPMIDFVEPDIVVHMVVQRNADKIPVKSPRRPHWHHRLDASKIEGTYANPAIGSIRIVPLPQGGWRVFSTLGSARLEAVGNGVFTVRKGPLASSRYAFIARDDGRVDRLLVRSRATKSVLVFVPTADEEDPAPPLMQRIRGRYRWNDHLLTVKTNAHRALVFDDKGACVAELIREEDDSLRVSHSIQSTVAIERRDGHNVLRFATDTDRIEAIQHRE